ncbi:MAG: hypothetical protein JOZ62_03500 [Acidobacteriaceae bacterium]|nr:hypothetical protein [Acidobacteriaceae bacterium]
MPQQLCRIALSLAIVCSTGAFAYAGQARLGEVRIIGNNRLDTAAIIAASGLHVGAPLTKQELDAAPQTLLATGFFSSVNYRYSTKPVNGVLQYSITFEIVEEQHLIPVTIDILGFAAEALWPDIKRSSPLIDTSMPDNDAGQTYYKRALETVLREHGQPQEVISKREIDLKTRQMQVIFRPANAPKVMHVAVEGNRAFDSATLERAIHGIVVGQDYSDRDFRQIVQLNITPMYEERGYLKVAYPRITGSGTSGEITVTVAIDEGGVWRLGAVDVTGDNLPLVQMKRAATFPQGKIANWHEIVAGIAQMEQVLRSDGYLRVQSNPARSFHEDTGVVDLNIAVATGPQYLFSTIEVHGLTAKQEQEAYSIWDLHRGSPFDEPYSDEYVRRLYKMLNGRAKSIHRDMQVNQAARTVDVVFNVTQQ